MSRYNKVFRRCSIVCLVVGNSFALASCLGSSNNSSTNFVPSSDSAIASSANSSEGEEGSSSSSMVSMGKWVVGTYKGDVTLDYAVFVPNRYDGNTALPLITFIGDSTTTGKPIKEIYDYEMACVNATSEAVQTNHPSFVLTIAFTDATGNGSDTTDYGYDPGQGIYTIPIIDEVSSLYKIDQDKLFLTGQSGGGMCEFELNYRYPNKFCATYYVACHWNGDRIIKTLSQQNFLFTASANAGAEVEMQTTLMGLMDADKIAYTHLTTSAKAADEAASESAIKSSLAEGKKANYLTFSLGTIGSVKGNATTPAAHTATWRSSPGAYTFLPIYDWLFSQTRPSGIVTDYLG